MSNITNRQIIKTQRAEQIVKKLAAEGAQDISDETLDRLLLPCVGSRLLANFAKQHKAMLADSIIRLWPQNIQCLSQMVEDAHRLGLLFRASWTQLEWTDKGVEQYKREIMQD